MLYEDMYKDIISFNISYFFIFYLSFLNVNSFSDILDRKNDFQIYKNNDLVK